MADTGASVSRADEILLAVYHARLHAARDWEHPEIVIGTCAAVFLAKVYGENPPAEESARVVANLMRYGCAKTGGFRLHVTAEGVSVEAVQ
jgi:hypothetical protein